MAPSQTRRSPARRLSVPSRDPLLVSELNRVLNVAEGILSLPKGLLQLEQAPDLFGTIGIKSLAEQRKLLQLGQLIQVGSKGMVVIPDLQSLNRRLEEMFAPTPNFSPNIDGRAFISSLPNLHTLVVIATSKLLGVWADTQVRTLDPQQLERCRDLLRIAEQALEYQHSQELLQGIPDALFSLDNQLQFTYINPSGVTLLEPYCSPATPCHLGQSLAECLPEPSELLSLCQHTLVQKAHNQAHLRWGPTQKNLAVTLHPLRQGLSVVLQDVDEHQRSEDALKASLAEKVILLKEIHHRVKNNLQIISSLLRLQSSRICDPQLISIFRDSQNRILAMALIHERLYRSKNLKEINLAEYTESLVKNLLQFYRTTADEIQLKMEISQIDLEIDTAICCGLILHELVSNALKHAFTELPPDQSTKEIYVGISSTDPHHLKLVVRDNGVGIPPEFCFDITESLGLQLVYDLVDQARGVLEFDRSIGTQFVITIPYAGNLEASIQSNQEEPSNG